MFLDADSVRIGGGLGEGARGRRDLASACWQRVAPGTETRQCREEAPRAFCAEFARPLRVQVVDSEDSARSPTGSVSRRKAQSRENEKDTELVLTLERSVGCWGQSWLEREDTPHPL